MSQINATVINRAEAGLGHMLIIINNMKAELNELPFNRETATEIQKERERLKVIEANLSAVVDGLNHCIAVAQKSVNTSEADFLRREIKAYRAMLTAHGLNPSLAFWGAPDFGTYKYGRK